MKSSGSKPCLTAFLPGGRFLSFQKEGLFRIQIFFKKWTISGPNGLSKCPESREMDFGPFRETYFSIICWARQPGFDPELFMTEHMYQ